MCLKVDLCGEKLREVKRCGRRASRNIAIILFFALAMLAARPARAASCQQSGVQTWETFEDLHPVGESTQLLMEAALRTDCGLDGNTSLYYQRVEGGLVFQPLKHLQIRPYYFLSIKKAGASRSHGINLAFTANNFKFHHWGIRDENRIEEDFLPSEDTTRYTNELEFNRRVRVHGLEMEPYLKGYVKYDLKHMGWAYERVYAGFTKTLKPKLLLDVYYVRHYGTSLDPGDTSAIGLTVRGRF